MVWPAVSNSRARGVQARVVSGIEKTTSLWHKGCCKDKPMMPREVTMHCTPKRDAVEALGARMGEQVKAEVMGIMQRLSAGGGEADTLLGWFEQEVMCAMKGVGQSLLAGLCALLVE